MVVVGEGRAPPFESHSGPMLPDAVVDDVVSLNDFEDDGDDVPYVSDFLQFIDGAVTAYHGIDIVKRELTQAGYRELQEVEVSNSLLRFD